MIGCLGVQFIDVWVSAIVSGLAAWGVTFDPPTRSTPGPRTAAIYGRTSAGPWSCRLQGESERKMGEDEVNQKIYSAATQMKTAINNNQLSNWLQLEWKSFFLNYQNHRNVNYCDCTTCCLVSLSGLLLLLAQELAQQLAAAEADESVNESIGTTLCFLSGSLEAGSGCWS